MTTEMDNLPSRSKAFCMALPSNQDEPTWIKEDAFNMGNNFSSGFQIKLTSSECDWSYQMIQRNSATHLVKPFCTKRYKNSLPAENQTFDLGNLIGEKNN
jgi:hypothetical protein